MGIWCGCGCNGGGDLLRIGYSGGGGATAESVDVVRMDSSGRFDSRGLICNSNLKQKKVKPSQKDSRFSQDNKKPWLSTPQRNCANSNVSNKIII